MRDSGRSGLAGNLSALVEHLQEKKGKEKV
jgi:hypothetical protein